MKIYYKNSIIPAEDFSYANLESESPFIIEAQKVVRFWLSDDDTYSLKTSGSTGAPSIHAFYKKQFYLSAKSTIDYFGLSKYDNLLCCLPPDHAAGMMMIIRALILNSLIILVEPNRLPLVELSEQIPVDFAAFVPYQFASSLNHFKSKSRMNKIKNIILGGGGISSKLISQAKLMESNIFHTYGMTETLTHIAIRRLNGKEEQAYYRPFKNVQLSCDLNSCLEIVSPVTLGKKIKTNDIVRLYEDHTFEVIGRFDNTLNSAGIKINLDILESKSEIIIEKYFGEAEFFYIALPDDLLGQKLVLFLEHAVVPEQIIEKFKNELKINVGKYEVPRQIFFVELFEKTILGKIDKGKTIKKIST